MAYYEVTIKVAAPFHDALIRRLTDKGCPGVIEQETSLIAYFPETVDIKTVIDELSLLKELLATSDRSNELTFSHVLIPDQDWNASWKEGFKPIDVGKRFTVLPPWEEKRKGRINLVIDPAMAFGTGHHETTRSCLVLMEKYSGKPGKDHFLDLGTGSGILAIAAAHLGFREVTGIDNDPLAVEAARKNIELNEVRRVAILEGSVADLNGSFDFVAANLISGVLVTLAPEIAAKLRPGGIAVLSGILFSQSDEVVEAMNKAGLKLVERYRDGKWISLVVRRGV